MSSNPLSTLKSAESALVQSIDSATDMVAEVATGKVDEAVDRFACAIAQAQARLVRAANKVQALAGDLVTSLFGEQLIIENDVGANAPTSNMLPAPALAPAQEPTEQAPNVVRRRKKQ